MKSFFGIFIIYLISFNVSAQQEQKIKTISSIKEVTVFLSGAQISRSTANIDIPKGVNYLVFEGVSPDIDEKSIQIKGNGAFTILSVSRQLNFMRENAQSDPDLVFQNKINEYSYKINSLNNELEVYKAEEEMLMKNQTIMNGNTNYDVAKLKQALDFQSERLRAVKDKKYGLTNSIKKLNDELLIYKKQYLENNGVTKTTSTDIAVKVSANAATKGNFSIDYMVKNASWYPFYDLRAKDINSKVNLVYKANVMQNSGEDWKNVKLTLSTGNPTIDNQIPSLRKYELGYSSMGYGLDFRINNISSVSGKVVDDKGNSLPGVSIRVKNSSLATTTDATGNYNLQLPSSGSRTELIFSYIGFDTKEILVNRALHNITLQPTKSSLDEVVVVGYGSRNDLAGSVPPVSFEEVLAGRVAGMQTSDNNIRRSSLSKTTKAENTSMSLNVNTEEQPTNINFAIKNPYTINSDGKNFTVDISSYDIATSYEYYAVPKLTPNVFLQANLTDLAGLNLITGEASIFFDGTYLGKTIINTGKTSDTLNISLGIDKNVTISREKEKTFKEVQFLGSNKRESRSFVIDVKNKKSVPINITIEDHLPVPVTNDITMEKQDISGAILNEQTGKLLWKLNLPAGKEQKLFLKYQVRSPRNSAINLE